MHVYIGSDHAGFELKQHLTQYLKEKGYAVTDCGPAAYDPEDDYPEFCIRTGKRVVADPGSLGIVIGGSGNGEQIAANKVPGVRAALAWSLPTARLSREHNNANVVSVGARMHTPDEAAHIVMEFLTTAFSDAPRHTRRISQITEFEGQ